MQHLAKDVVRMLGLAICMELTSLTASAQPAPKAPANLCIAGAVCVAATAAPGVPSSPTPPSPSPVKGGAHKWHPGFYVRAHTAKLNCGTACDAGRHNLYAKFWPESNVKGTEIWISWKSLESDSGNDFSAGFSWLHNEINYIKANYPGKQVGLLLDISPYGWAHGQDNSVFPTYFVAAGCTYDENSAATSGGSTSLNWFKDNATCRGYFKRMIAAYGAEFDSEPALEFVRIQQETDDAINNVGISGTAEDAGWKDIALAAATAFPTTLIWIPLNWSGVDSPVAKESLLAYYKSIHVGVGDGDTIPAPKIAAYSGGYPCPSGAINCVIRGLNAAQGASSHDYCGEFVSLTAVELSEMGYGSVGPHPGLTSAQVMQIWNDQRCAQYGIWEPNFGEAQDRSDGGASQYWNGSAGQKWAIDNIPLTHTTKPAGYP